MKPSASSQLKFDRDHIWHPYTSATKPLPTQLITQAEGVHLSLEGGKKLVDGMASWWCAIHGYNHPTLNAAAESQIKKMSHVMFGGLTHTPAIELCKKLIAITPDNLQHVFLADSGSISVEVAMKMAIQYWQANGMPNKSKMLSLRGGYHGDTFAAMSVCDPETGMHHLFNGSVSKQVFTERPNIRFDSEFDPRVDLACGKAAFADLEKVFDENHESLAAVVLEPIVQGAGGMWFYHPSYLKRVRELCDNYNVLLIADEIATGFGRTGKLFACEWAGIEPDILCLGKALTGGYMTLAATLTTGEIAHGISQNGGVFMHGPTFMGNPLACAVADASVALLLESPWERKVSHLEHQMTSNLEPAKNINSVKDVRVLGGIGVIEMTETIDVAQAQAFFINKGVWIRPFGKLIYIMPPYIINDQELKKLCSAMCDYAALIDHKQFSGR